MSSVSFAESLLAWFQHQGRKNLPWQSNPTAYRVWVSEIMLQQTQVATVIDYYQTFMARFPDLSDLATASLDEVLHLWAGLGYYSRARNLHACARQVQNHYQGRFPVEDLQAMQALPGIGPSTAAAIVALSSNRRAVILDGNVKRVIARFCGLEGWPGKTAISRRFWAEADCLTPKHSAAAYTQAIMDLGATLCKPRQPACNRCPVAAGCQAKKLGLIEQLPTPKPRKTLPEKTRLFLLLHHPTQGILLQQRPASGIWGGLWCLPEFTDYDALQSWLTSHYPQASLATQAAPGLRHSFSHYHLQMQPWHAWLENTASEAIQETAAGYITPAGSITTTDPITTANNTSTEVTRSNGLWYNKKERAAIGLPAPVKRLLKGHSE